MRFSVVVPTLNRAALLREALSSIAAQTYPDWEVIVVDDGSEPPVSQDLVEQIVGNTRLKLVRHDERRGVPAARNAGLDWANGDVVLYLDDDDLLMPAALQILRDLFRKHPTLDCIFANVDPIGKHAEAARTAMEKALDKLVDRACIDQDADLYFFGPNAFFALLESVPLPMQRPAARRSVWNIIGGFLQNVPFSEPEWAMRAAASCRIALTRQPLQSWRVDGQNIYSQPEMYGASIDSGIDSFRALLEDLASQVRTSAERASIVQTQIAKAYLSRAWFIWQSERRTDFEALWLSFRTRPGVAPIRFLLRNAVLSVLERTSGSVKT